MGYCNVLKKNTNKYQHRRNSIRMSPEYKSKDGKIITSSEQIRIWKETIVVRFKILCQYSSVILVFNLVLVYLTTLAIARITQRRTIRKLVNNTSERMQKKAAVAYVSCCLGVCLGELSGLESGVENSTATFGLLVSKNCGKS